MENSNEKTTRARVIHEHLSELCTEIDEQERSVFVSREQLSVLLGIKISDTVPRYLRRMMSDRGLKIEKIRGEDCSEVSKD